ncbi:hypothetical protein K2173_008866 [Erythroxylum novogranatense]|uniref:HTH three-helical bundle domain-containing protein n=1 Tax=Erythroxylum novogranatense TaxID=1862640 RepID=A0AAV8UCJ1_9ROSI|nr:hypothetical protein K2173_008866 [Erythroxylum novogranatense]
MNSPSLLLFSSSPPPPLCLPLPLPFLLLLLLSKFNYYLRPVLLVLLCLKTYFTDFHCVRVLRLGFDHELSKSNFNSSMSSTSSSLITNNQASSKPTPHRKIGIVTVVSRRREMKFQVARRRRTEVCWSYDHRKVVDALPIAESSASTSTEGSCLSSSSSARRECMSRSGRRQVESAFGSGSVHIRRRAEAIMKLLSRGCFSEVEIRQVLGDSPDTSKALRM